MEIQTIIGRRIPKLENWILSEQNHPLAPDSNLTAVELIRLPEQDVRDIMRRTAARLSGRGLPLKESFKGITVDPNTVRTVINSNGGGGGESEVMLHKVSKTNL